MKKTILILAAFSVFGFVNAQKVKEAEVPAAVKAKLSALYPNVKVEKWEKENGNFEAEFDLNKIETSVVIDPNGNLLETETEIKVSELPKAATDYIAANVKGKKVSEAAKITDAKGTVTFEAEAGNADYIFDANGNFITKVLEKDDDKEDDDKK